MPETGWIIKNMYLFLLVLAAGKSKIMALTDSVSIESLLPGLPPWCHLLEGESELSGDSFMRVLRSFTKAESKITSERTYILIPSP